MDLVIEDEDQSTTSTSDDVGKATLEEGTGSLISVDLGEAVHGTAVHLFLSTGGHHESTSDGIKRVGNNTGGNSDELSETPNSEEVGLLHIFEEQDLTSVEKTEVRSSVADDTNDGDTETSVETLNTILGSTFLEAVNETGELSILSGTNIGSESGSTEIKRVDNGERSSTGSSTGGHVTKEEHTGLLLGVIRAKPLLVGILTGEVKSLSGEIPDNVSEVTSPESDKTLFLHNSGEAVTDTIVSLVSRNVRVGILDLEEELDSLDRGDDSLGDGSRDTTNHEIDQEVLLFFLSHPNDFSLILLNLCEVVFLNQRSWVNDEVIK